MGANMKVFKEWSLGTVRCSLIRRGFQYYYASRRGGGLLHGKARWPEGDRPCRTPRTSLPQRQVPRVSQQGPPVGILERARRRGNGVLEGSPSVLRMMKRWPHVFLWVLCLIPQSSHACSGDGGFRRIPVSVIVRRRDADRARTAEEVGGEYDPTAVSRLWKEAASSENR